MASEDPLISRIGHALPWLARYPAARARALFAANGSGPKHLIFCIANHFEPSWNGTELYDIDTQRRRLDEWCETARKTGEAVTDADGTMFRHTNFYPAEQYDPGLLSTLADLQRAGLGEVEVHLHHGVDTPDTEEGLRRQLVEFRDRLAGDHGLLSQPDGGGDPMYAFVHGNWALGNSSGGRFCGVDTELAVLSETGCYADMTLPSAPDRSQVPVLNSIYQCSLPMEHRAAHARGDRLRKGGGEPKLPVIITGPLMFDWTSRTRGLPLPKLENGELANFRPMDIARLRRWVRADVTVKGRPDWVFIKLHCHGFFDHDRSACIGEDARRFFSEIIENGERTGEYTVHFASAREMFNMVLAAVDGREGPPGGYRDYRLRQIMTQPMAGPARA